MSVYEKENPKYLDVALNSIINQTVSPNEIVIVKDGKLTDDLDSIINKYSNKYSDLFKIIHLKENIGLGKALSIGILSCKYDLIARMDSDDICKEDRFEKQINLYRDNRNIDLVGSYISEFENNPNIIKKIRKVPINHNEIVRYSKRRNPLNHMTVMYKKDAVLSSGNYQDSFLTEDYDLWVRMILNNKKFINIAENLVNVRCNEDTYKRRGGLKYIKSEYKLQKKFLDRKFINFYEFSSNLLIRIGVRILPNKIREYIYNKILREKIEINKSGYKV